MLRNLRKNVTMALFLLCMTVKKRKRKKCMQYEVAVNVYMGRIENQRKVPNWLPFKNYMPEWLNI